MKGPDFCCKLDILHVNNIIKIIKALIVFCRLPAQMLNNGSAREAGM